MNRILKGATVQRYHCSSHIGLFLDACNRVRRLKTLKGLTPYECICRSRNVEPQRFIASPHHETPGPGT